MQKCSHKIPVDQPCRECDKLAKSKGLDRESQAERAYQEWCRQTEQEAKRLWGHG